MSDSLFREGGPNSIRRTGRHEYQLAVPMPTDEQGLVGRECPSDACSPAYFKIKPGTGITGPQDQSYCPYCRHAAHPSEYHTESQQTYARDVLLQEAEAGVQRMVRDTLGLDRFGRKKFGGGLISIEMSFKPGSPRMVTRPLDEELRRDLTCEHCGLVHAVFGLATWCPDCGHDLFLQHVHEEVAVTLKILDAVPGRRAELGARVAARDIENALEDLVSIFEAILKVITRRALMLGGSTADEADAALTRQVRNAYQSITAGAEAFQEQTGHELFLAINADRVASLRTTFEKRHRITHNLGVADRKYLLRAQTGELEGRDVRVTSTEVARVAEIVEAVLRDVYVRACTRADPPAAGHAGS